MVEDERRRVSVDELKTEGTPLPESLSIYPEGHQYPFDTTCADIVRQLERIGWQTDGLKITFTMEEGKPVAVSSIKGHDFGLTFGRDYIILKRLGELRLGAFANVGRIDLPRRQLHVFSDFSGPVYRVYTGITWERDRAHFWENAGNSHNHSLTYSGRGIQYTDGCVERLLPDPDANEGRIRLPWQKSHLSTTGVFDGVNNWLRLNVLDPLTRKA